MNENEKLAKELAELRLRKKNNDEMLALQRKRELMKREIWALKNERASKFLNAAKVAGLKAKKSFLEQQRRTQKSSSRKQPGRSSNSFGNFDGFGW